MKNKFRCLLRLEGLNRKVESNWKLDGFKGWKVNCDNKWLVYVIERLAKNPHATAQIALWRLRDSMPEEELQGPEVSRTVLPRKLLSLVQKNYELTIAKAFWMIETQGNADLGRSDYRRTKSVILRSEAEQSPYR